MPAVAPLVQGTGLDPFAYAVTDLRRQAYYRTVGNYSNTTPFAIGVLFRMRATPTATARQMVANENTAANSGFRIEINTSGQVRMFVVIANTAATGSSTTPTATANTNIKIFAAQYDGTNIQVAFNRGTIIQTTPGAGGYIPATSRGLAFGTSSTGAATAQCDNIDILGVAVATALQTQGELNSWADNSKALIDVAPFIANPSSLWSVKQQMSDLIAKPTFTDSAALADVVPGSGSAWNLPTFRTTVSVITAPTWDF